MDRKKCYDGNVERIWTSSLSESKNLHCAPVTLATGITGRKKGCCGLSTERQTAGTKQHYGIYIFSISCFATVDPDVLHSTFACSPPNPCQLLA
jgi:hypothetical protein